MNMSTKNLPIETIIKRVARRGMDTKLLPKVWISWINSKGPFWKNAATGVVTQRKQSWMKYDSTRDIIYPSYSDKERTPCNLTYSTSKKDRIWVKSGSTVHYFYMKYHADLDVLELASVIHSTCRAPEPSTWEYAGERFILTKEKECYTISGNNVAGGVKVRGYYYAYSTKDVISLLEKSWTPFSFLDEFKKFIGAEYFTIGNGNAIAISNYDSLSRWFNTKQKARSTGKQQKLVDKLTDIVLSNIQNIGKEYPPVQKPTTYGYEIISHIIMFEHVNEDWDVLRFLKRDLYDSTILTEESRIYYDKQDNVRITSHSSVGWIPAKGQKGRWNTKAHFINLDTAVKNSKRLKYILDSVNIDYDQYDLWDLLQTALRFPEIEQLCKLQCAPVALRLSAELGVAAELKHMFGEYFNFKETSFAKKAGLSNKQLQFVLKEISVNRFSNFAAREPLTLMRKVYGNNLSSMDYDSFRESYRNCKSISSSFYRGLDYYEQTLQLNLVQFINNIIRLNRKHNDVHRLVYDTLNSYIRLTPITRPAINWYFDDYSSLIRAHDSLIQLNNIQDAERRARYNLPPEERNKQDEDKRKKTDEERKHYEYEDNNYLIRLPRTLTEIVSEGNIQGICIANYTSSHANGTTNIFFLRKKGEEETPFYAIEMKDNIIIQIHGRYNRWLGACEDHDNAIRCVVKWCRLHGFACDPQILTSTATGYNGSRSVCIPMPEIY